MRPHRRGGFVVVVGPDGVGKTTVARELVRAWPGATSYVHFRPSLRQPLPEEPPSEDVRGPSKTPRQDPLLVDVLRLGRSLLLFWVGYLARVRPAVRRGHLVVADRWGYGYWGQPRALRYYGPRWLARAAVRALPRPDLIAILEAEPAVVVGRKGELTEQQVQDELVHWRTLPTARCRSFNAAGEPRDVAARILSTIDPSHDCGTQS